MKKLVNIEDANMVRLEKIKRITGLTTDTAVINLAIYELCKKMWEEGYPMERQPPYLTDIEKENEKK